MVDIIHIDKENHDALIGQHYYSNSNSYPTRGTKNMTTRVKESRKNSATDQCHGLENLNQRIEIEMKCIAQLKTAILNP